MHVKGPRAALVGFCVAMMVVHAFVAWWTPIQADDWNHWVWAGEHVEAGVGVWLRAHYTFSDALGYLLTRCHWFHVIVSPLVAVALVVGTFVIAMRRLPRATWDDVVGVALVSAAIWIAQPHAGVTWFHTPSVAMHVYGAAVAVWFVAPLRCGWQVPRALWPVIAVAGYCVGTSTRAIATATLVGVAIALRALPRDRRARWMWIALGSLVVGVAAGYFKAPWIEFARVYRRGLDQNLFLMNVPVQGAGRLISLVAILVLADLGLGAYGRARASTDERPDPRETLRWFFGWFATTVWCLFGPRYYEATLFPATIILVIAALPYVVTLSTSRVLRYAVVAIVIVVHAVIWPSALAKYRQWGDEGDARMAVLETTKPGGIAVVRPYSQIPQGFWFAGEDLIAARLRQSVAIEVFGLRDIAIEPPFRREELDPGIAITLEIDGFSDADLRTARVPAFWGTAPAAAREQFDLFVKRLRSVTDKPVSARLVVTNVPFTESRGRPLLAAWADDKGSMILRTAVSPLDEINEFTVRIYGEEIKRFNEAWIVDDGVARSTPYRNGAPRMRPTKARLNVVVICNKERCLVADAFVPRF